MVSSRGDTESVTATWVVSFRILTELHKFKQNYTCSEYLVKHRYPDPYSVYEYIACTSSASICRAHIRKRIHKCARWNTLCIFGFSKNYACSNCTVMKIRCQWHNVAFCIVQCKKRVSGAGHLLTFFPINCSGVTADSLCGGMLLPHERMLRLQSRLA